ncbi:MAG: phosphoglycerate mutase, partial [Phycisphaerae bacterium]|nr:phosphoglycerate mutase [Phycisphaerae bacterium]
MKYAIIIMDGAADEPLEELDGLTPLGRAEIPHIDWISSNGRLGKVSNVPAGFSPGSDVALMSLMGYDPKEYHTGRAPLEAAAMRLDLMPTDWIFRCNLVTVADGDMLDYSAGHIETLQAATLISALNEKLGSDKVTFYPGKSYRHLMVYRGDMNVGAIAPPHDIMDQSITKYLPKGKNSKELRAIMAEASAILSEHEVNKVRSDLGENPASDIWLWGH